MSVKITKENINEIPNSSFRDYVKRYLEIEEDTNNTIESIGLPFQKTEKEMTRDEINDENVISRNQGKSLYINWISPACKACNKGTKTYTTFISLKCHKKCYFCFNPNQENYDIFRIHDRNPIEELNERIMQGEKFNHIGLTGGEPLLHVNETLQFFKFVNENLKNTYTRLYTAGDLLTDEILEELKNVRLNEIRFSIKLEESAEKIENLLKIMEKSKEYIPNVVVEMPVIPGTFDEMKNLLHRLDDIGIKGINLLEFCFPLHNVEEYAKRGFKLKYPPFETYYNYWYAGGLAVSKSEEECLRLLQYASENKLKLGVHYCSLENKHTGQLYLQNKNANLPKTYSFCNKDFFIKSAKVFGDDKKVVKDIFEKNGITNYEEDETFHCLQFPISSIKYLKGTSIDIAVCFYVSELRDGEEVLREVKVEWQKPDEG